MKSVTADDEVQIHNVVSLLRDSEDYIFDKDIPEIEIKYLRAASIIQTEQKILDSLTLIVSSPATPLHIVLSKSVANTFIVLTKKLNKYFT